MTRKIQQTKSLSLQYPKKPTHYQDLAELPEKFTTTFDDERFLLFNKTVLSTSVTLEASSQASTSSQAATSASVETGDMRMIGYASR
jgi:hypothetical protein